MKIAILCNICDKTIDYPKEDVAITLPEKIKPGYSHRGCYEKDNERKVVEHGKRQTEKTKEKES